MSVERKPSRLSVNPSILIVAGMAVACVAGAIEGQRIYEAEFGESPFDLGLNIAQVSESDSEFVDYSLAVATIAGAAVVLIGAARLQDLE